MCNATSSTAGILWYLGSTANIKPGRLQQSSLTQLPNNKYQCLVIRQLNPRKLWRTLSIRSNFICSLIHEMHVSKLWIGVTMDYVWNMCGKCWFKPTKWFHHVVLNSALYLFQFPFPQPYSYAVLFYIVPFYLFLYLFQIFLNYPIQHVFLC